MQIFRYIVRLLTVSVILLVACGESDFAHPASTPDPLFLDYAVYRKVVTELYPEKKAFLVFERTLTISSESEMLTELDNLRDETRTDFVAKNSERSLLIVRDFQLNGETVFTSFSQLYEKFGNDDPDAWFGLDYVALKEAYPDIEGILACFRQANLATGNNKQISKSVNNCTLTTESLIRDYSAI